MFTIILQSAAGGGGIAGMIFPIAMIVVIYVFFLRPQNKRRKDQETFQTELKPGQEIVTTSGIIGKISKITDSTVTVIVSNNTTINFMRSSISKELTDLRSKA
jgi:preprotein translocase subunit YajC